MNSLIPQQRDQEENVVVRTGKKFAIKKMRKLFKKGALAVAKALMRMTIVLTKMLITFLVGIFGPSLLLFIGVIFLVIIIFMSVQLFYSEGVGLDKVGKELRDYIILQSNQSVDLNDPLQRPYKVPPELIIAVMQIEYNYDRTPDKEFIKRIAELLKPTFEYDQYNEYTESYTETCSKDGCTRSPITRTDHYVSKLTHIEAWNTQANYTYKKRLGSFEKTGCSSRDISDPKTGEVIDTITTCKYTRKMTYVLESSVNTEDYSMLDSVLNSLGYGLNDKKMVEALYLLSGGKINYINWLQTTGGLGGIGGFAGFDGTIIPGDNIPAQFMKFYIDAEKKYGVDWYVLAAIHYVETGFSTHKTMVSSVGAIGPMQFLPATWVGWKYNIGGGQVSPSLDITSLAVIKAGGGYGKDGDGDGKADPWNEADAIHTAASYLAANGYSSNPRGAIWQYNHAEWYVNKVLNFASVFRSGATYLANGDVPQATKGAFMRPATGEITSGFGPRWGKMHYGVDIGLGGRSNVPIVAVADGVVKRSYYSSSYGNVVFIQHNINGVTYETVYAHMKNRAVSEGQRVKKGQFLGYMGATGHVTGPHLHFEIHQPSWNTTKSNAVNPVTIMPF
ncbi:Transglycosylase SLT domain-containing protein [Parageobacillus thermantarcticus]|uniref:Transglycosylase SLT domain-containing protein n=1 Tax=Parageobacillus thermantarcticus TaxID=186116 RepID=A0A1I0TLV7_9BACL|nr:peptidoglycan DD-metalloendopeptidase family protein [Parageobacillus thermantarcticus]SFA52759.1 Transglycosylase SLT domain-containing protein [Parageobacillus thermantarcticus]